MGFCYFHSQDFTNAALSYERLVSLFPNIEEYRLYYAQALYHASMYDEAMNATCQIDNPEFQGKVIRGPYSILERFFCIIVLIFKLKSI